MRNLKRKITVMPLIFALPVCAALMLGACGRNGGPVAPPAPIPPIHNFQVQNLLAEFPDKIATGDYAEQVQLLLFLRTDGAGVASAIAGWNALQQEFSAAGFTVLGVVVDERPSAQLTAEATALNAAFPIGRADEAIVTAFGGRAAIRAIPTAFLLSRTGAILRAYAGFTPLAELRADIAAALADQPLPPPPPPYPPPEKEAEI